MITFIRHAEAENNTGNHSEKDTILTYRGRKQASFLKGIYDLVVCSTLWRAKETLLNSRIKYDTLIYSDLCSGYKKDLSGTGKSNSDIYQIREEIIPETEQEFEKRCTDMCLLLRKLLVIYQKVCVMSHSTVLLEIIGRSFDNAESITITWDEIDSLCKTRKG